MNFEFIYAYVYGFGARCSAVSWDTELQAGRLQFQFPMGSFRPHYGPLVDSACNKNEYQDGDQCVRLSNFLPSCTACLEIWEPQPPRTLRDFPGLYRNCFPFIRTVLERFAWPSLQHNTPDIFSLITSTLSCFDNI